MVEGSFTSVGMQVLDQRGIYFADARSEAAAKMIVTSLNITNAVAARAAKQRQLCADAISTGQNKTG